MRRKKYSICQSTIYCTSFWIPGLEWNEGSLTFLLTYFTDLKKTLLDTLQIWPKTKINIICRFESLKIISAAKNRH